MSTHCLAVLDDPPRPVRSRFDLAARRLIEGWLGCGRIRASAEDVDLAGEFLGRQGFRLDPVPGLLVQLTTREGLALEMTREDVLLFALRRLAGVTPSRRETAPRVTDPITASAA